jgi:demethylmenaquinone methyltransferase/2-methoxy-6-polyprenyl-1,4-benzoquinol methylase
VTVSTSKAPARIAGMFDDIAGRYDLLNRLLSGGLDARWRRKAVDGLELTGKERLLDVCTGTGDVAIAAAARPSGGADQVVGVDFSGAMLRIGLDKVRRAALESRVRLAQGDATQLPLPDGSFDAAIVAFGIRNVVDLDGACGELYRVLRPGGRLAILEFGMPRTPGISFLYRTYFRHIVPRIGRAISRHRDAYEYLPVSVSEFPSNQAFADVLRRAGFSSVRAVKMTMGSVFLYLASRD